MTSHKISLRHVASGDRVEALLHENVDRAFAQRADSTWDDFLSKEKAVAASKGLTQPEFEHGHWQWEQKIDKSSKLLSMPAFAIECDNEPQGVMLLITDGYWSKSQATVNQPIVYVQYLSTAPWNLPGFISGPRYRGVGTVLLSAAIQMSVELGFKGRLGLHSLPQSEAFYECHNFELCGIDTFTSLKYYELSAASAAEFLR